MNTELLLIIALQKQRINKTDRVSFIKLKKIDYFFFTMQREWAKNETEILTSSDFFKQKTTTAWSKWNSY